MEPSFYASNRRALVKSLGGGLIILFGYGRQQRSNDAAHHFVQESNFWYLSGIEEPESVLVIDGTRDETCLVLPKVSDVHKTFDGSMEPAEATAVSGIRRIIDSDELESMLRLLASKHELVHTVGEPPHAEYFNFTLNPSVRSGRKLLDRHFSKVRDISRDIASLRAIKQPAELSMIQKAIDSTIGAFTNVKNTMATAKSEYELEASFGFDIRMSGARGHAYDPIIAAGHNACTLHYGRNAARLRSRQLVLMDVGASFGGYAADITRTYAKGEPTKRQISVHAAVDQAHHRIIELLAPALSTEDYQKAVDGIMRDAIESIGLWRNDESLRRYFPHAVSHGLGIDVHDSLGAPTHFKEHMVLTVEPGIYIPEESIGVRIEDDIVITSSGHRNMSRKLSTGL